MIRSAAAAALAMLALLSGCANVAPLPGALGASVGESVAGRLALRGDAADGKEARSMSAAFELQGRPEAGQLDLSTPLGTRLAQARWTPGRVVLTTPQGETPYPSLDALTSEVLGESLPVAALFDWLRGRPWSGAAYVAASPGPGFRQLGWNVDLARFAEDTLVAVRELPPAVSVRVKIEH